jgi:eukaryotic-like serine/threonine-protein kinase
VSLSPGTRLGPYELTSQIGAGGMGEVYKARDTRLNRTVAIKVLPLSQPDDAQARDRFDREARAIAALTHPHICTLYDVGVATLSGGASQVRNQPPVTIRYLVMEHLDGETLADRLRNGPLAIARALHYAVQIASALDKAHRGGIAHRDLKPANVMLVKADAKLLDFGLAKRAMGGLDALGGTTAPTVADSQDHGGLETITTPGMIIGTVQYMAPEQLEGRDADARTDVFAFGAVLYEMLSGSKAFPGATQASVVAAILDREPASLAALLPSAPPALDRVVMRCLAKDPDERWQSTADLASELRWIEATLGQPAPQTSRDASATQLRAVAVTAVAALAAGAIASAVYLRRAPDLGPEMRLQVATPGGDLTRFALSPDGRKIVFEATIDGKRQLWLRPLDRETAQPLPGTEDGQSPFWSPDSRSIAFFANGQLKVVNVTGGPPLALASSPTNGELGATWGQSGWILFVPRNTGPVYRIPAGGGKAEVATRIDPQRITAQWHPYFLPDGRHFLFFGLGTPEQRGIYIGSLDSNDTQRLFDSDAEAVFAAPDLVIHARQGALVAQRLDLATWKPVGDAMPVAEAVATDFLSCGCAAISPSAVGPIAYRAEGSTRQFTWVDRSGFEVGTAGSPEKFGVGSVHPSPDGQTVAFTRMIGAYQDVWLLETAGGILRRFTFDAANKVGPVWSPDGQRIVFSWDPQGVLDLYEKPVDGAGNGTLLWSSAESKVASDWSPDGRFILYTSANLESATDLSAMPLFGDRKPVTVAHTPFSEGPGRFSPDGRWVAYQSNETGRAEIYVQPFPGAGRRRQITSGGGTSPQWGDGGRVLFYLTGNGVTEVAITSDGHAGAAGKPVPLFTLPPGSTYAASRDGRRFLVSKIVKEASPVTVLLNWKPQRSN